LSQDKRPAEYDQNRYYAAEMLALVLSLPPELVDGVNEARHRVGTEGWVDALLKVVSVRFAFSAKAAFPFLPRVAKTGELFPPKLMVRARKKKKNKKKTGLPETGSSLGGRDRVHGERV
jgi:hypothetical protein